MHPSGVRWCRRPGSILTCLLVLVVTLQVVTSRVSPKTRHPSSHQNSSSSQSSSSINSGSNGDQQTQHHRHNKGYVNHHAQQQVQSPRHSNLLVNSSRYPLTTVTSYVDTPSGLEVNLQELVTIMAEDEAEDVENAGQSVDASTTSGSNGNSGGGGGSGKRLGGGGGGTGGKNSHQSRFQSSSVTHTNSNHNHNNNYNNNNNHNEGRPSTWSSSMYGVSNCSRCRMLEETINVTKEAIKLQILSKLGLKVAPNITKRALPRIPPLDHLLDMYNMQGDMAAATSANHNTFKPGPVYEEAEDDYHAKMEKIISFAQEPPVSWGLPSSMAIQYFKFSHAVMVNKVVRANLWVYLSPSRMRPEPFIWLHVYKVCRSETNMSHVLQDHAISVKVGIKHRKGTWFTVDIKKTVGEWFRHPNNNLGIVIQAFDNEGRQLVATDRFPGADTSLLPFLEVYVMDESKRRTKRMIGLNCDESSHEVRCCRYPLKVDFEEFGWDWIIAPKSYEANYCSGECPFVFLQKYPHTHLVQQANPSGSAGPCCAPRKMSPISMLYFDHEFNIIYGLLPGMVVDRCGCS